MVEDWLIWRIVWAGKATLREIDRHWTLSDILDANELLDADLFEQQASQEPTK